MSSRLILLPPFAVFFGLLALVWVVGGRPGWRIRAVVYGWLLSVGFALAWCTIPLWLRGVGDAETLRRAAPSAAMPLYFLLLGWFWPALVVGFRLNRELSARKAQARKNELTGGEKSPVPPRARPGG